MKTEELESMLEQGTEIQSRDYKDSCPWHVNTFAKDILAMANVQAGGTIVVGVKEEQNGTFVRQGVLPEHLSTYKGDTIMDQMAQYADPNVYVKVEYPKDKKGRDYVIITVEPFRQIPVICRKDGTDIFKGRIYYRNTLGKPESAAISNSYDMRDLIDRAVIKAAQRPKEAGFTLPTPEDQLSIIKAMEDRLKKERGDL